MSQHTAVPSPAPTPLTVLAKAHLGLAGGREIARPRHTDALPAFLLLPEPTPGQLHGKGFLPPWGTRSPQFQTHNCSCVLMACPAPGAHPTRHPDKNSGKGLEEKAMTGSPKSCPGVLPLALAGHVSLGAWVCSSQTGPESPAGVILSQRPVA